MLIKLGITLGVSVYLTKWLVTLMEPMIDQNYKQKKNAEKSRQRLIKRLGCKDIETNEYEDMVALEAVNPADIECTFADIGGLDEQKKRLRELVVLPFARPELFKRGKLLRPPKGGAALRPSRHRQNDACEGDCEGNQGSLLEHLSVHPAEQVVW